MTYEKWAREYGVCGCKRCQESARAAWEASRAAEQERGVAFVNDTSKTSSLAAALIDAGMRIANLQRDLAEAKEDVKWANQALWEAVSDIGAADREGMVELRDQYIQRGKYHGAGYMPTPKPPRTV